MVNVVATAHKKCVCNLNFYFWPRLGLLVMNKKFILIILLTCFFFAGGIFTKTLIRLSMWGTFVSPAKHSGIEASLYPASVCPVVALF